jgi:hypothetical protein
VQYLNDKISKSRIDQKNFKKENQNLKDSNENHIFINEKLNQALKKAVQRNEELEKLLERKQGSNGDEKTNEGEKIQMVDNGKKQISKESTLESNNS